PGFVVYNPETMLRLRSIAGNNVGCNFDPSHLFWQSIDPIGAVRVLADCIFHVHAKDTQLYPVNLQRSGVLDTKPYTEERIAPGSSVPAAMDMELSGGVSLSPLSVCSGTITCSRSNMKIACSRRQRV